MLGERNLMTPDEQLKLWVAGDPVHNEERNQCCPDFSCCVPELLASEEERIAFRDANEKDRSVMLGIFLARMLRHAGMEVKNGKG